MKLFTNVPLDILLPTLICYPITIRLSKCPMKPKTRPVGRDLKTLNPYLVCRLIAHCFSIIRTTCLAVNSEWGKFQLSGYIFSQIKNRLSLDGFLFLQLNSFFISEFRGENCDCSDCGRSCYYPGKNSGDGFTFPQNRAVQCIPGSAAKVYFSSLFTVQV